MSYTIEGLDGDTMYMLMINAINTRSGKQSFPVSITVRTLVAGNRNIYFTVWCYIDGKCTSLLIGLVGGFYHGNQVIKIDNKLSQVEI